MPEWVKTQSSLSEVGCKIPLEFQNNENVAKNKTKLWKF